MTMTDSYHDHMLGVDYMTAKLEEREVKPLEAAEVFITDTPKKLPKSELRDDAVAIFDKPPSDLDRELFIALGMCSPEDRLIPAVTEQEEEAWLDKMQRLAGCVA